MYYYNRTLFEVHFSMLQEREGIDSGLYTIKWFLQCFLDRVCTNKMYFLVDLIVGCHIKCKIYNRRVTKKLMACAPLPLIREELLSVHGQ